MLSCFGCMQILERSSLVNEFTNALLIWIDVTASKNQGEPLNVLEFLCRGRPTDMYALGACLFTFVFGRIPFNAPNVFKLFQIVQNEPLTFPSRPAVSPLLHDLLLRLLHKVNIIVLELISWNQQLPQSEMLGLNSWDQSQSLQWVTLFIERFFNGLASLNSSFVIYSLLLIAFNREWKLSKNRSLLLYILLQRSIVLHAHAWSLYLLLYLS